MTRLINAVGLVMALLLTVMTLMVVGILGMSVLAMVDGSPRAALGMVIFAVIATIPIVIAFLIAWGVRSSRALRQQPPPPPPPPAILPPAMPGQPHGVGSPDVLLNPDDLR